MAGLYAGPIVDAHHHLWRYTPADHPRLAEEDPALTRDVGPRDYRAALVAHCPLDAPDVEARLDRLQAAVPNLRGIRDIVSHRPGGASFARRSDLLADPAFARGLAALPNTAMKISAPHCLEQRWTAAWLRDIVDALAGLFGVARACFGTDFPVRDRPRPAGAALDDFKAAAAGYPPGEQRALFHDTARRLYRIDARHRRQACRMHGRGRT